MNQAVNDRLSAMFEQLVPISGKADSLAGEHEFISFFQIFYHLCKQCIFKPGKYTCSSFA